MQINAPEHTEKKEARPSSAIFGARGARSLGRNFQNRGQASFEPTSHQPDVVAPSAQPRMRHAISTWDDRVLTAMMLMMVMFSLLPGGLEWTEYETFDAQSTSWRFQVQWLTVFGLGAVVAFRHSARTWDLIRAANPFLLLMIAYTAAAILWSAEPSISFKRVFQFGGLFLAGVAFQLSDRPIDHLFNTALFGISVILLLSTIAALLFPSLGVDPGFAPAWRGILNTKNDLGFLGGIGLIVWVVRADTPVLPWSVVLTGIGISALCMLKATSSTGIATSVLGVTVFLVLRRRYVDSPLWLTRLLVSIGVMAIAGVHWFFIQESRLPQWGEVIGPFAALFGKGTDLTGRTEIWEYVLLEIQKHPMLGVGWGAFWLGPGSASQPVLDQIPWIPFQAHNGYLDMLNELGLVGFGIFVCMLLTHAYQLTRMLKVNQSQAALHATLAVIVLFTNFSESTLYKSVAFHHMLLIVSSVWVSSSLYRQRNQAR